MLGASRRTFACGLAVLKRRVEALEGACWKLLTLIFRDLQVVHPVRLFLCVLRPIPYPWGCCMGFGGLGPDETGSRDMDVFC